VRAGFDGTSMDEVARSAGVTRLIVYRIFTSKEELYRAVLEQVTSRLGEEFATIVGDGPPHRPAGEAGRVRTGPHDRIAGEAGRGHAAAALLRVAREDPDAFRLLWLHAAHEPPFAAYHREFRTVADAMAADLIRPYLGDPTLRAWAAPTLVAHLYDGVIAWLDRGRPEQDDAFVATMSRGVRALVAAWAAGAG
jgi:AcrR family transcriptional regulator